MVEYQHIFIIKYNSQLYILKPPNEKTLKYWLSSKKNRNFHNTLKFYEL